MAVGLETFDKFADVLIAIPGGHENNIRRRGDDEVVDAERRDQLSVTAHITPGTVFQHHVADRDVARPVLVAHRP